MNDDSIILDRTVADQVSMWKSKRGLTDDESVMGHVCSGNTCSYTKIGDVFICEKTGRVHVCDDTCREVVLDQSSGTLVCTISGHCFDSWLSPEEETDADAVRTLQFHPSLLSPFLSLTHTHTYGHNNIQYLRTTDFKKRKSHYKYVGKRMKFEIQEDQ